MNIRPMEPPASGPPSLRDSSPIQKLFFGAILAVAYLLLAAVGVRLTGLLARPEWWMPIAFLMGIVAADFVSGLVHWGADTWGRDDTPILGPLLLVPFRVHHVNPDDFRRRHVIEVNGDVAILAIPALAALLRLGVETRGAAAAATFGFAFCGASMLTNQIHQWAHIAAPPRPVRWLQACGLFLSPSSHALHHDHPYDVRYCITTGWCNRPLEALGFFRSLEGIIRTLTRAEPRRDDGRYRERYGSATR